jgi:hypothetical protein
MPTAQALDDEKWASKLSEAKRTGKLNISYCDLPELTAQQVADIKVRQAPVHPSPH